MTDAPAPVNSSVCCLGDVFPPKAKAAVWVPAAAKDALAVFKSVVSVQAEPFHNSVFATGVGVCPPNTKPNVCIPEPATKCLAVFKSATSVQLVPFQDSVIALAG